MSKRSGSKAVTIMAVSIGLVALVGWSCSQHQSRPGSWNQESLTATVPSDACPPILLDGLFSDGEWDDALTIETGPNSKMLFQQDADYFYIGVDSRELAAPAMNLFLAVDTTEILQFHVSAQVAERTVTRASSRTDNPAWNWGYSDNWMANEVRWNERDLQQLVQETGESRQDIFARALYPSHGAEFQFRKSRFDAGRYYFRLDMVFAPDYDANPEVFPVNTLWGDIAGWALMEL